MRQRRTTFIAWFFATMAVGLIVHKCGASLGIIAQDILGDALWAAMIAWGAGALMLKTPLALRIIFAYTICVSVEVSQLYHTATLDALRATQAGHLVLGSGFDPRDLLAYALGVASAAMFECGLIQKTCITSDGIQKTNL